MEQPPYIQAFVRGYLQGARSVEIFFRIPVSVILAISAIESDWGRSALARKGIIFGQALLPENATTNNSVSFVEIINKRTTTTYYKKLTTREAMMAFGESLRADSLFENARRNIDNPDKFLGAFALGVQAVSQKILYNKARAALKECSLTEYDSWLHTDALVS